RRGQSARHDRDLEITRRDGDPIRLFAHARPHRPQYLLRLLVRRPPDGRGAAPGPPRDDEEMPAGFRSAGVNAALAVALLACSVDLRAEQSEIVFTFSQVKPNAAAAFRRDLEEARRRVREWWGASFEERIAVEVTANQVYSIALVPAWRGERGRMIF